MTKRKALGKGLSALIPGAGKIDDEGQFFMCPVESIEANPMQPRQTFTIPEMEEMISSVIQNGVITPLLVTKTAKGYQLIAGERRWRAAQKAGLDRVPVVVKEVTPIESLELALIENIHRKDLNPIEEGEAYKRLIEGTGLTQDELAKKIGKNRTTITNTLRLLKLPVIIQKDVINGDLSMGHARVLAGLENINDQKNLRDIVIKKSLSVRQLEELAKKQNKKQKSKDNIDDVNLYIQSLADNLKRSLGTKVNIKKKGKKEGRIEIYFYSDDELDRILQILSI